MDSRLQRERVVLHCDMNNYFASVESLYNSKLKTVPAAVCGDPESRHGIVLARNYHARRYGIATGESVYTAKAKCPGLLTVTANYNRYIKYTRLSRSIYARYSTNITPYGLDEAWVELDPSVGIDGGARIADEIRHSTQKELGLTISVGVSDNFIFSKLGSDIKKPDATTVISRDNYKSLVWSRPAFELLFVGSVTRSKLYRMGIISIGDIATCEPGILTRALGKRGYMLWEFANGIDSGFCPTITDDNEIKSIGNTITTPRDIDNNDDIAALLYIICCGVAKRLDKHGFLASCVGINIKSNDFSSFSRRTSLSSAVSSSEVLFDITFRLFRESYDWSKPVRSIGVVTEKLSGRETEQQCLFPDTCEINPDIMTLVRSLRGRLGKIKLEECAALNEEVPEIENLLVNEYKKGER